MTNLRDIIAALPDCRVTGNTDLEIAGLELDSRKIQKGFLYAAMPGTRADGHDFISQAVENGATVVLCNHIPSVTSDVTYLQVEDVAESLGQVCRVFFKDPSATLTLVGTTGTNGKTTVSTLLFELFSNMGHTCGLVSTVEYRIGSTVLPSTHTTPDIIGLYRLLRQMVEQGCSHCFMEVSSHAAHQKRIAGLSFSGGIFTNITHDHLDYHGTFANYIAAKKSFFDRLPSTAFALTNKDDRNGQVMLQNTKASRYTYAMSNAADFSVKILESDFSGTLLQLNGTEAWVQLVGGFNAYNLAAVYGAAFLLTEGQEDLVVQMSKLGRVNGRFETVKGPNRISGIIDYAHTPDALENVLNTINDIRSGNCRLITVVGCGGNRDAAKRPEMGKIATRLSDRVVFTSDNPRDEDPEAIIQAMEAGVEGQHYKRMLKITDRREAIRAAVLMAEPGDVILIAGKGHETYQEIRGVKHPFDDKQILRETFEQIN
ncbi:MAG: UDP-N-acetylmuramoyl-L-alanyl-D-glutamate--2,6-diaminopimelate ligase [Bacteroidetes bacterium]|nr:UDP-N-acetylmuramoyl-L-alanyl-D-glutamate--2,6-diaminopimelate ligase [Bacteroidota bacterium]